MPNKQVAEQSRAPDWAMLALVVLVGLNLRPFLTAPGPLLDDIVRDTGLGLTGVSLLTLLPMFLMGVGAFVAPGLLARFGARRGLLVALAVLALGSLLRLFAVSGAALVATAGFCGAGVAFIQAAFPGIMKQRFPTAIAGVTGLYSAMIMGGGAFGAWAMPALADAGYSWRTALAWLAAPVAVALAAALFTLGETGGARPDAALTRRLLGRPRIWALMAAFGLVNAGYSSMVAWLSPYYQALGWTSAGSAGLVAVMALCQAVAALGLPLLAQRRIDRRPWLYLSLAMQAIGFAGLAFAPAGAPMLWAGICGAGLGGSFALAIVTALDHLPVAHEAGAVAALMQGGGFLIAAFGPYAVALLHDATGGFAAGWIMHLVAVAVTALIYLRFDPERYPVAMAAPARSSTP